MKVLYFAWVRQRTGTGEETVDVPDNVSTVGELAAHLATRDEGYAAAFENMDVIRAAVDQEHVDLDHPLAGAREVAFFPPVTGG
ncbi:MAG: molybdopterin converting factor subunit 1 [Anderseniella sp.]|nr:molybdopterin converting factor subunit 1 [Anderseniella sp.]